ALENHFAVIPADRTWRPQPLLKPLVDGPQSAVVTGPAGEEIFCDEHGRVRVKFNWDRYNPADQDSSCWIRVAQAWAGTGFGHLAIPRVGQEVIVDFLNGDPDQPIIMGRTYHQENRTPGSLPGTKTQMTIRSKTYKGSGFNELKFDDATGKEQVYIHAQKNMNTEVLNNRTTDVINNHAETIGNNQMIAVTNNQIQTVTDGAGRRFHLALTTQAQRAEAFRKQRATSLSSPASPRSVSSSQVFPDTLPAGTEYGADNGIRLEAVWLTHDPAYPDEQPTAPLARYTYTAGGELRAVYDRSGMQVRGFTYDAEHAGRMVAHHYAGRPESRYRYDDTGRVT
ncbi:type VI secretion system tip protein TssI/VgrG, partial [Escherichia coli]